MVLCWMYNVCCTNVWSNLGVRTTVTTSVLWPQFGCENIQLNSYQLFYVNGVIPDVVDSHGFVGWVHCQHKNMDAPELLIAPWWRAVVCAISFIVGSSHQAAVISSVRFSDQFGSNWWFDSTIMGWNIIEGCFSNGQMGLRKKEFDCFRLLHRPRYCVSDSSASFPHSRRTWWLIIHPYLCQWLGQPPIPTF